MSKFVCSVCGYSHEGEAAPEKCPLCGVPADKFNKVDEKAGLTWVTEHVIGVAQGQDPIVVQGLKDHFKVNEDNTVKASVTYYEF